jgi:hypothetical protein
MGEMASLFSDDVFNIGSDETSARGRCSVNTSFAIERRLLNAIQNDFKKTPAGWEEVLFDAGAATLETIVDAWLRYTPAQIAATGRHAIQSQANHFYLNLPPGPGYAFVHITHDALPVSPGQICTETDMAFVIWMVVVRRAGQNAGGTFPRAWPQRRIRCCSAER